MFSPEASFGVPILSPPFHGGSLGFKTFINIKNAIYVLAGFAILKQTTNVIDGC